jgi:AraC-like DNA-binding protein
MNPGSSRLQLVSPDSLQSEPTDQLPQDSRVLKALELIAAELSQPLRLAELARQVNLSVGRLEHLFRAEVGCSPTQYLASLRMERAKELLATTHLSVKQIREQVGAHDPSHFARDFKIHCGMTAKAYRLLCQTGQARDFFSGHSRIGQQIAEFATCQPRRSEVAWRRSSSRLNLACCGDAPHELLPPRPFRISSALGPGACPRH